MESIMLYMLVYRHSENGKGEQIACKAARCEISSQIPVDVTPLLHART